MSRRKLVDEMRERKRVDHVKPLKGTCEKGRGERR